MIKRYIQSEIERWIQDGNNGLLATRDKRIKKSLVSVLFLNN